MKGKGKKVATGVPNNFPFKEQVLREFELNQQRVGSSSCVDVSGD